MNAVMTAAETDKYFADMRRGFDRGAAEFQAEFARLQAGNDSRFKVISPREFIQGRPSTPEEEAHDAAIEARLDAQWLEEDDAEDARERPNRVITADKFAGTLKPREWRIKGVQPLAAELCVMYGDSGSGKSFLLDDMAAHVHLGRRWNGRDVIKGRVIKIVAEGAGDHRYRLHAQAAALGVPLGELPPVIDSAPDLSKDVCALDVAKQIKAAGGCDLLIIDTLAATNTLDENSSELGEYIRNVKLIQRAIGCTVWVVHHSGKNQALGARGWSGLRAAVDVELEVARDGDLRSAEVTKAKGGKDGDKFGFKLVPVVLGRDKAGDDYGSCRVEYTDDLPTAGTKIRPKGANQIIFLDVLKTMAPSGTANLEDIINGALVRKGKPLDAGKQTRDDQRNLRRAVDELIAKKLVWMHGGEVSLTPLVTGGADDF